jgi:hypothetical protein
MGSLDQRLLDGLTLLGLVGSVFGALFILYDLLGRPGGPVRWAPCERKSNGSI